MCFAVLMCKSHVLLLKHKSEKLEKFLQPRDCCTYKEYMIVISSTDMDPY